MANIGNIAATASLNIDPFQQSARVLETQTRSIDRALKATELSFKNSSKNINAQRSQYQLTGKSIDIHNAKLQNQKEKYNALKAEIGDVNNATVQQKTDLLSAEAAMNKTAGEIENLTNRYNNLGREIAINESSWTKSGKVLEDFGNKTSEIGDNLNSFGNKMTLGVTAPIVAGVTAVTKAAMDWESSFAGVKKTSDEVVDSNGNVVYSYKDLEAGLRSLARELPSTHAEIANVAEAAGQLGIATEDITSFTKTMINMGESTNMSAEEAATAIAKIANITGMTSDEYERFGSSVVALGNNFATTESQIVAMANKLAASGTLAGLSETEILGLATAMSSVGIEAEAGGTAMTQTLTAIEKAAVSGGKELDQFANIAGMSSEKFAQTWKDKPIEALQSFIKGLGELDAQGESATLALDEMGLSGVRQGNMLKSLALASETLTDAVGTSAKAWEENTALSEEAAKRYATVESQLKMLKNEAVDVGIELGGPFLEALRSGLQASKPFISTLSNMATKFSEMNPETQQSIMKFIGLAAAIGPASKVLGGFLKITGGGISTVGKMAQGIGKMSGTAKASKLALDAASTGMKVVGTSATVATGAGATGLTGFVAGLGTIAVPAAIAVGAVAAIGTALYVGKKAYDDHQLSGAKWGTEVTKEQDKVIEKSYELQEEAVASINAYSDGVFTAANQAVESNQKIVDSIQSVLDKELERKREAAKELEDPESQKKANAKLDFDEKVNKQLVANAQSRVDKINEVITNASNNQRKISDEERQYISANYKMLSSDQLKAAGFTAGEIVAIQSAYQDKLSKLTYNQLQDRSDVVTKALDTEKTRYEKQLSTLEEIYGKDTQAYKAEAEKQKIAHEQTADSMIIGLAKLKQEQGISVDMMAAVWEKYGYTVEEVENLIQQSTSNASKNLDMFAQGISEADIRWNELAFDPKTGEVKTNMADTLIEIAETEDGWEQLKFIAKNADLTSNAKEEIAIAMGEVDKWQFLSMEDKLLLLDNDETMLKLYDSIDELGKWDVYNADRKELGVDNADAMYATMEAKGMLDEWIGLPIEVKTLLTQDESSLTVGQAQKVLEVYESLSPKTKKLLGDNTDVNSRLRAAEEKLNSYERNNPKTKHLNAVDNASDPAYQATNAVNTFSQQRDRTVTLTTRFVTINETIYQEGNAGGHRAIRATGDPYFQGGQVWLGDGGKQEPYLTPQGDFGISPADWTLYDLPRGTKIWPSISKLMESLPQYSKGTQFDDTNISRLNLGMSSQTTKSSRKESNKPTIIIQNLNWNNEKDIRKTMQEMDWIVKTEERGAM